MRKTYVSFRIPPVAKHATYLHFCARHNVFNGDNIKSYINCILKKTDCLALDMLYKRPHFVNHKNKIPIVSAYFEKFEPYFRFTSRN